MGAWKIRCPGCGVHLELPEGFPGRMARCSLCRHVFPVPRRLTVPEDTISSWLHEGQEDESAPALEAAPARAGVAVRPPPGQPTRHADDRPASSAPCPRIVSLEQRGVLLEFPTELLNSPDFRCSIPRVCIHCLGRMHLAAHLILYSSQLRDSVSLEAEHRAGQLSIPQDRVSDLHGEKLLAVLPNVPSVPFPGCLPMPYWVCDLCSAAGEISGQIQVNAASGRGQCRLHLRNLHVAASFFAAAGGSGTADDRRLREFIEHAQEDRWDALPSMVRHRLQQWYRATPHEKFLAYVPDRDFIRTEDGMAGLIVTDRRIICHRVPRHHELPAGTQLLLQERSTGGKHVVTIDAAECRQRSITLDRSGMMLLRRALAEGHFNALWK